ncbi:DddA-like double-stranded DNA deaminase toxin [Actinokineospora sp. NBRC 105648]|uniref:DddA-like double-stranded DNA deaminase toxin n=1 Tax=Actinokineospora sp. NBRC 105648 TaxID=3032206 RepID=UPI0024A03F29|nr:DddA-like double-stranded DNA deaminase toxin [Actinokineospora sp. NBRC 105648]GLZ40870.1 hypothetical protein Acsp05_44940 [Actinokineospora sp. NBRC 105648]
MSIAESAEAVRGVLTLVVRTKASLASVAVELNLVIETADHILGGSATHSRVRKSLVATLERAEALFGALVGLEQAIIAASAHHLYHPPAVATQIPDHTTRPVLGDGVVERVDQLRRGLPPDIPPSGQRPPGEANAKTHGRWIDKAGEVREEISGWDDKYRSAVEWFTDQPGGKVPWTASDVEVKLAVHMRNTTTRQVTLAINNIPCKGRFGCDALVPQILPEGYTLTVHGAGGFHKVYRGRAK